MNRDVTHSVPTPAGRARLVVFSASDDVYASRTDRRRLLLSLRPSDPTELSLMAQTHNPPAPGAYWEYLLHDDTSLIVRSHDLPDADEARLDARSVFDRANELRVVYVRDPETGRWAWWLVLDDEVLLLSSRLWVAPQRNQVVRNARRALVALQTWPGWGDYSIP